MLWALPASLALGRPRHGDPHGLGSHSSPIMPPRSRSRDPSHEPAQGRRHQWGLFPSSQTPRAPSAVPCVTSDKCLWASGQQGPWPGCRGGGQSRPRPQQVLIQHQALDLWRGSLQFLSEPHWFRLGQEGLFGLLKMFVVCFLFRFSLIPFLP